MHIRYSLVFLFMALAWPFVAQAHVSEGGLVLLMPTGFYTAAGLIAVVLSAVIASLLTPHLAGRIFVTLPLPLCRFFTLPKLIPVLGFTLFIGVLVGGFLGEQHPLENPMPLYVWTLLWLIMPVLQVIFGDIWSCLNPWRFPIMLLGEDQTETSSQICWPALFSFLAIYLFAMVDPAPDAPARLALITLLYWAFHMGMILWRGTVWLQQGEGLTVFFTLLSRLSSFAGGRFGLPGHGLHKAVSSPVSGAIFAIAMLAAGSYDGLNETFWWLAKINVNPLAFPGRSAVVAPMVMGFFAAQIALFSTFTLMCVVGWKLAHQPGHFRHFFAFMSMALLPIAAGYHIAHYLTSFLINGQYLMIAVSEMFHFAHDTDHAETWVTTGFLNRPGSVRILYTIQASAIVLGHILAILLSHSFALHLCRNRKTALKSQLPLIIFMIAYTFLGLWLLASPRGV